jgi:hypothetical protein
MLESSRCDRWNTWEYAVERLKTFRHASPFWDGKNSANGCCNRPGNVIVQIRGDGNSILADLPHLRLAEHRGLACRINTTPDTNKPCETNVLRASTRSIPRVGREREMADLRAWLNRGTPISVQVMTGGAGHGKTRLALELIVEMTPRGWRAGFLTRGELRRFREQHNLSEWGWNTPVLAVVDYASASAGDLHAWLKELAANAIWEDDEAGRNRPLRLLLLERHARREGWWAVAFGRGNDAAELAPMLDPAAPYLIEPIERPDQRRQILATTLARLGSTVTPPAAGDAPDFDRRLAELTWGGVPLLLMMAAATAAREGFGHVLAMGFDTLAFNIAETELARIRKVVMGAGVPWTLAPLVDHLVAVATLWQGILSQAAVDVIKHECAALGYDVPGGPATLHDALADALSDDAGGIAAVEPDLIGEALLLSA